VQRTPETTIALVVARRAPKIAFLSTASPIRSRLRTIRSAEDWDAGRRVASLIAHRRTDMRLDHRRNVVRSPLA
jgi:hypothetical protein